MAPPGLRPRSGRPRHRAAPGRAQRSADRARLGGAHAPLGPRPGRAAHRLGARRARLPDRGGHRPRGRRARSGGVGLPAGPQPVRDRLAGAPRPAPAADRAPAAARARAVVIRPARLPRGGVAARRGRRGRDGVGRPRGGGGAAGTHRRAPRRAPPDRGRGLVRRAPAAGRAAPGRLDRIGRGRAAVRGARGARLLPGGAGPHAAHRRDGRGERLVPGGRHPRAGRHALRLAAAPEGRAADPGPAPGPGEPPPPAAAPLRRRRHHRPARDGAARPLRGGRGGPRAADPADHHRAVALAARGARRDRLALLAALLLGQRRPRFPAGPPASSSARRWPSSACSR